MPAGDRPRSEKKQQNSSGFSLTYTADASRLAHFFPENNYAVIPFQ